MNELKCQSCKAVGDYTPDVEAVCLLCFDNLKEENARLWKTIMTLTHGYCKFCVNRDKDYDESPCVDCAEDKLSLGFELDKKTLKESEDK